MARPRKEINKDYFENLCWLQCTKEEISRFFSCSEDTIERWCKREYKQGFADVYKKHSAGGKISLRRAMLKTAVEKENPTMQIWLSRNWLGMSEHPSDAVDTEDADAYFNAAGINEN